MQEFWSVAMTLWVAAALSMFPQPHPSHLRRDAALLAVDAADLMRAAGSMPGFQPDVF